MRGRTFGAFFLSAFLIRFFIAAMTGMFHRPIPTEMEAIGMNVATFGTYWLYGGPTAFSTPVFPLFLAGINALFGTGVADRIVEVTLACGMSALRCALVPLFALEAGLGRPVAMLAGCLGVVYIAARDTEMDGGLDGPYVALALVALTWAALRLWRDGNWQKRTPWGFFLFCGFAGLLNPSVLAVIGGFLAAGAIACPAKARRRYLQQAALAVAGILVFLLPWAIRNDLSLGAPVLTRSNFGMEFWVSNGPERTFDHPNNYGRFHPSQNPEEGARVQELGEVEYSRERFAEGIDWVRTHPGEYLRFTAERFLAWWFPPHPLAMLGPKLLLTLAAFFGLWRMFRRQAPAAWPILITWIAFPDVYYLVQWSSRYRYPMEWQILLCGCVGIYGLWEAVRRPGARPVPADA